MSVVSVLYYRAVTGDNSTAASAIEPQLDDAESMLEDYLGRTLAHGVYTERLKVWVSGFAYPSAIPITSTPASANYQVYDEACVYGVEPEDQPFPGFIYPEPDQSSFEIGGRTGSGYETKYAYGTVTYEGGFTEETMPVGLKRAIVALAQALFPAAVGSARPTGATMARVGDVQISWNKEDVAAEIDQYVPGLSRKVSGWKIDRK